MFIVPISSGEASIASSCSFRLCTAALAASWRVTIALLLVLLAPLVAQAETRVALLIGNQGYNAKVGPLKNPHNDISLIGAALEKLGFKTTLIKDADYRSIDAGIKRHIATVRREGQGTISFVYYSGHGAADPDTKINYLIPVDVPNADDEDLWNYSLNLNTIVEGLRAQAPGATHYVVFDACRNELNLTRKGHKALSDKGFVPISYTPGVMVAYATAPGRTASDIGSGGGIYAKALAEEIVKPGVDSMLVFTRVARRVLREIGQDPFLSASTMPEIYFASETDGPKPLAPPTSVPPPLSEVERAFASIKDTIDIRVLEAFRRQYGSANTLYDQLAVSRIEELKKQQIAVATPPPRLVPSTPAEPAAAIVSPKNADPLTRESTPPSPQQLRRELKYRLTSSFPKSMSVLGPDHDKIAANLKELSGGKWEIQAFAAGEIVPGLQVLDAVSNGTVEMGWTLGQYYWGKDPAFGLLTGSVPFGRPAPELVAWATGAGAAMRDKIYGKFDVKAVACHVMGPGGMWSRRNIASPEDLKGLKLRVGGVQGIVAARAGVVPQQIAGGDIYPALERGTIDGVTWATPNMDVPLGFFKVAKYYYFPSWHQPAVITDLLISKDKWNGMIAPERQVIEFACKRFLLKSLEEIGQKERDGLAEMAKYGVKFTSFPQPILKVLQQAAEDYLNETARQNADFKEVLESYRSSR